LSVIFDGYAEAKKLEKKIRNKVKNLKSKPSLGIIQVGDIPKLSIFTDIKKKKARELGVECTIYTLDSDIKQNAFISEVERIQKNHTGILIQLPLPKHIDRYDAFNSIQPEKDVEGVNVVNVGKSLQNEPDIYSPVAKTVMHTLRYATDKFDQSLKGKKVTLMGYSYLCNRLVSQFIYEMGATITICSEFTQNLSEIIKDSEIVISSVGKKDILNPEWINERHILIDAGFEVDNNGKVFGDISKLAGKNSCFYTPTPGGLGPITVMYIYDNLLKLYQRY
jgi:methylenetetrahydrofolate dehydrogenase (NADP+)/methenyltetrahydrofolate cyclohydrolase